MTSSPAAPTAEAGRAPGPPAGRRTARAVAAALADAAIGFYVFVYTLLLKRRSPANIVIGGAAGCFPVLVGWAAVTGTVAVPALVLFAVIFLWTPPHFWALAMKFKDDYARANVPMLPVVASPAAVTRKIVWYSYAMVAATLALARTPAGFTRPRPPASARGSCAKRTAWTGRSGRAQRLLGTPQTPVVGPSPYACFTSASAI